MARVYRLTCWRGKAPRFHDGGAKYRASMMAAMRVAWLARRFPAHGDRCWQCPLYSCLSDANCRVAMPTGRRQKWCVAPGGDAWQFLALATLSIAPMVTGAAAAPSLEAASDVKHTRHQMRSDCSR